MTVIYPAIFTETKDEKDTILIYIPDLDGMTEGYGIDDSIKMAKDFIGNALCNKKDSEFPAPSAIENVKVEQSCFSEAGTSFVSLVDIDIDLFRKMSKNHNVRRNITLPEWLDEMATKAKINVSAVAQMALKETLGVAGF